MIKVKIIIVLLCFFYLLGYQKQAEELISTLMLINSRPKKCLNYAMLFEKFLHEINY